MKICFECGSDRNIVEHHVVPRSRGGTKTVHLCQICHDKVHGHKTPRDISVSQLTKEGMKRAKERGSHIGPVDVAKCVAAMNQGAIKKKKEFAAKILPVIRLYQANGCNTLQSVADNLNENGILTRTGKKWSAGNVYHLLKIIV